MGEQTRQLVDAVRNIRILTQLFLAVNGHEPYWRINPAATVTEICTLVDLLFGRSGRPEPGLLQILSRDVPSSAAIPILGAAGGQIKSTPMPPTCATRATILGLTSTTS